MKSQSFAYMLAIFHASIVGLSFLFTKMAIAESNPIDTLAFRFSVSFANNRVGPYHFRCNRNKLFWGKERSYYKNESSL
ncbi:hypothetical protein ACIGC1_21465 [Peribacillus butanolivorans]|uniref:hypothetical protein n=1 Tax=Peribacillus butanolivorans TaxID=421767 RepID=UPI0037C9E18B